MTAIASRLTENLAAINQRITEACRRAGREPTEVTLIAVVKYAHAEWVRELVSLGVCELGESRPQQLLERAGWFDRSVHWHLVGHLQRNKARKLLPAVSRIHSVDSLRLLSTLNRLAGELEIMPRVLLQVNVSGEETKHGFSPKELRAQWDDVLACQHVNVAGLMTMAPHTDTAEDTRPVFRRLRELRETLRKRSPESFSLPELSMGMSNDFEIAVEEGATFLRLGSRLFDGLPTEPV